MSKKMSHNTQNTGYTFGLTLLADNFSSVKRLCHH